jgi:hypothetical protein
MIGHYLPNNNEKCYSNISQKVLGTEHSPNEHDYGLVQFPIWGARIATVHIKCAL